MTTSERDDHLDALAKHRGLFRHTVEGLTDEQATRTPTASELCLGGLIKHATRMETRWASFILEGPAAMAMGPDSYAEHLASFQMTEGDTIASVLAAYETAAARTDELVRTLPDFDVAHPLPEAPWFEPGARWTARRVLVHIVAETAQHAGHADILRETIDGQKTMG